MVHYEGVVRHLRPLRVHQTMSAKMATGQVQAEPAWFRVVAAYPPSTSLVRTLPPQLETKNKKRKSHKELFKPHNIIYPEDELRKRFYKDHPWELARPRILVEVDGADASRYDWSKLRQLGKQLDGESVVQHQLWLMENEGLEQREAYDVARKKFYALRLEEDIERRIAKEEALHVGAEFPYSHMSVHAEQESKFYEKWKKDALEEIERRRNRASSANAVDEEDMNVDLGFGVGETTEAKA